MITIADIKPGLSLINTRGTVFIVDEIREEFGKTYVLSSLELGSKGNYRNEISDFVSFMNEENCTIK